MGKKDKIEEQKNKKLVEKVPPINIISDKEGEDLFKIALRNYLNLVDLADKKAGLLIQVNTILASVVGAFGFRIMEITGYYAIPLGAFLIGAVMTIFYSILASKPIARKYYEEMRPEKEEFFFGSFDRLDPEFQHVTWEKYLADINQFFKGDKRFIFEELIKESFEVRKVISKKFVYINIAYKIFFIGLALGIIGTIGVVIYDLTVLQAREAASLTMPL